MQGSYKVAEDYVKKNKIASVIVNIIGWSGVIISILEPPFLVIWVILASGFQIATSVYQYSLSTRIIREKSGEF